MGSYFSLNLQTLRRGTNVLVIHPGSRNLRIGRASDVNPVSYPSAVARRQANPVSTSDYVEGVSRLGSSSNPDGSDDVDDPVCAQYSDNANNNSDAV